MKIYYDEESDSAYIELSKKKPSGVVEVSDYINVDTTSKGEIIGIEFLNASEKISIESLYNYEIEVASMLEKPVLRKSTLNRTGKKLKAGTKVLA